jgi:acyl carrier protein
MTRDHLLERLAGLLANSAPPLSPDALLTDLPGWDSMGKMELLAMLDDEFNVTLEFGLLAQLATVADILALVDQQLEPQ